MEVGLEARASPMSRVIAGLSGGVDSAVAALLLQQQGHDVTGVFMKNWDEDDETGHCPAAQDLRDAQEIADKLGIAFRTVSFSSEYWDRVFTHFIAEYRAGRTPSPDVICNREIKFSAFLDFALDIGADFIATGHYARLRPDPDLQLLKGVDSAKDQTYFLHTLERGQLEKCLFPLGELQKSEVRDIARKAGFSVYNKKDSTGICFIGERRFDEFLSRYIDRQPGDIVSLDGQAIGRHRGLSFYTIGQRQGLGIGGLHDYSHKPWYVAAKSKTDNTLVVVQGTDNPALYSAGLQAGKAHWIIGQPAAFPYPCTARIRHQQPVQACTVFRDEDESCRVIFDKPQRAIAPGQSVVFYDGDVCLGGAVIESALDPGSVQ